MYCDCPPPTYMIKISAHQYKRHETVDGISSSVAASLSNEPVQPENSVTGPEPMVETEARSVRITCVLVLSEDLDSIAPHRSSGEDVCFICMEQQQDAVLLECGHSGLCVACASSLWAQDRRCPLCRKRINSIMRIVMEEEVQEVQEGGTAKVRTATPTVPIAFHAARIHFRPPSAK